MTNHSDDRYIDETSLPRLEAAVPTPEVVHLPVESLFDRLGFKSTPELDEACEAITAGLTDVRTDPAALKWAWMDYEDIVEKIVSAARDTPESPKAYAKAHVAASIHKALIFFAAGDTLRYLEELDLAEVNAYNEDIDGVSKIVQSEIDEKISTLEMSPEVLVIRLKGEISEIDRAYLRDLIEQGDGFDEIVADVYGMILDAGGDPNEILARIGAI